MMKKTIVALGMLAAISGVTQASDWGYEGQHGPEHWGEHFIECAQGKNQSPIDIRDVVEADIEKLNIDYLGKVTGLTNNGHTLQAVVEGNNQFKVDGKVFTLAQFHFHTPSENLIDSRQFPLEAHFVNADDKGNLAVVAVMFDTVEKSNHAMATLLAKMPTKGESVALSEPISISDFIPKSDDYYRFNGSLTTPPCSEGVRWFVLKSPHGLSTDQVAAMEQVMGKNNRPVQAKNARLVVEND